jgi:hypothetical protein
MIEARIASVCCDVDVQAERGVLAVAQLDHAGHAHEIDACPEIEAADDRRAREDEDRDVLVVLDQRVRDGAAAAEVPEAEAIVAIDEDACLRWRPSLRSSSSQDALGRPRLPAADDYATARQARRSAVFMTFCRGAARIAPSLGRFGTRPYRPARTSLKWRPRGAGWGRAAPES